VLDLEDDAQTDGGDVQQWEWLDGDNQHWRFERL
jgi:hypothetical protein